MKHWKYFLFAGVASGFLLVGADQIHAQETTPQVEETTNVSTTAHHQHTWVQQYKTIHHDAQYETRYVVDKEAWTEQVPQYTTETRSICNVCGADITDNAAAHTKAHLLAGDTGAGYHSEVRQVVSGYETVNHPEEGHNEQVLVKEAYDEKVPDGYICSICGATSDTAETQPDIDYSSHIQDKGWESQEKSNGELSGTQGEGKRLEAVKITIPEHNDQIQYQAHVQNYGWMNYVSGGQIAGTVGDGLRIEALRIKLLGDLANQYNVLYRVHVQNYGWLTWVMNDAISGTIGQGLRIEALEILLSKKDASLPQGNDVSYGTHVQNIGWQSNVQDGQMAGTSGLGYRLEGIQIHLINQNVDGSIRYQTHVQNLGWQDWKSDGQVAGTVGQGLRLEAIRIQLVGSISDLYDVYYRVHAQDYGWLAWSANGQIAGTSGLGKRLEALEILLVERAQAKPTSTETASFISPAKTMNYTDWKKGTSLVNEGKTQVLTRTDGRLATHIYRFGNTVYVVNGSGIVSSSRAFQQVGVRYMSQLDGRWRYHTFGGYTVGQSACGGVVSAMLLNSLLDTNYTPLDTCNYLYNAGYYNRGGAGTANASFPIVADEYGLNVQRNLNYNSFAGALQIGKLVVADIYGAKYGNGVQHYVLCKGYSNGMTYVYDPYNGSMSGWCNLAYLWNHRSTWETSGGGPFYAFS